RSRPAGALRGDLVEGAVGGGGGQLPWLLLAALDGDEDADGHRDQRDRERGDVGPVPPADRGLTLTFGVAPRLGFLFRAIARDADLLEQRHPLLSRGEIARLAEALLFLAVAQPQVFRLALRFEALLLQHPALA